MSNYAEAQVWDLVEIKMTPRIVLLKLADCADDDCANIFPAVETVAKRCSASERTVQRTIGEFRAEGVLILLEEGRRGYGTKRGRGRCYRIDFRRAREVYGSYWEQAERARKAIESGAAEGPVEAESRGDNLAPLDQPGATSVSPQTGLGVTNGASRGDTVMSPDSSVVTTTTTIGDARDENPDDLVEDVQARCLSILGLDRTAAGMSGTAQVARWLRQGCDVDLDIIPTVQALWERKQLQPNRAPPKSLRYFTEAVLEARDRRLSENQDRGVEQSGHEQQGAKAQSGGSEADIRWVIDRHKAKAEPGVRRSSG